MRKLIEPIIIFLAVLALIASLLISITTIKAEAKTTHPRNGWYTDARGNTYYYKHNKVKTGYFKVKGKTYYGHKTNSTKYPKGSITKGEIRIKSGNRWYAFDSDGKRIEKDLYVRKGRTRKFLQLDIRSRNHTVRYIYNATRTRLGWRYSTSLLRWQRLGDNDKWHTVESMQSIPYEMVDLQK